MRRGDDNDDALMNSFGLHARTKKPGRTDGSRRDETYGAECANNGNSAKD